MTVGIMSSSDDDNSDDNQTFEEMLGGPVVRRHAHTEKLGRLALPKKNVKSKTKEKTTTPNNSVVSGAIVASSGSSTPALQTDPTDHEEKNEEDVEKADEDDAPSKNLRQNPAPTVRLTPSNTPVRRTANRNTTDTTASSTPGSNQQEIVQNAPQDCFQDLSMLNFVTRKCKKPSTSLNRVFTREEMLIGIEGAAIVTDLRWRQEQYIQRLAFPYLTNLITVNSNYYKIDLEPHINIYVQYMMYLLSLEGLGTVGVLIDATNHLSHSNYFARNSPPVLSKTLIKAIFNNDDIGRALRRIPDNWKTLFKKKGPAVKAAVKKLYDYDDILEGVESILRPVSIYLGIHVSLSPFSFSLSISSRSMEILYSMSICQLDILLFKPFVLV
jgi:hypothetical protein